MLGARASLQCEYRCGLLQCARSYRLPTNILHNYYITQPEADRVLKLWSGTAII